MNILSSSTDVKSAKDTRLRTSELKNRTIGRKSVVTLQKIKQGEALTLDNIGCKRPGTGISPMQLGSFLDTVAKRNYEKDELMDV